MRRQILRRRRTSIRVQIGRPRKQAPWFGCKCPLDQSGVGADRDINVLADNIDRLTNNMANDIDLEKTGKKLATILLIALSACSAWRSMELACS